jgi:hypothetical protein
VQEDKKWLESKKFLALIVVLGVILVLGIVGMIYHAEVAAIIGSIVTFASSHQIAQGAQDFIAKYKTPAESAFEKAKTWLVDKPAEAVSDLIDDQDRYANR